MVLLLVLHYRSLRTLTEQQQQNDLTKKLAVSLLRFCGQDVPPDQAFYEGKVAAASFFTRQMMPLLAGERAIAENIDASIMELDEAAF